MEENNKIIAEFMGWKEHSKHKYPYVENKDRFRKLPPWYAEINGEGHLHHFNYNADWNWLMPVVEKIYQTNLYYDKYIDFNSSMFDSGGIELSTNINQVYNDCVKFINFYNKQKEN